MGPQGVHDELSAISAADFKNSIESFPKEAQEIIKSHGLYGLLEQVYKTGFSSGCLFTTKSVLADLESIVEKTDTK